jgi:hypothetical protein
MNVVGSVFDFVAIRGDMRLFGHSSCASLSGIGCILLINGTQSGVLFLVTLLCICGVVFRVHFEVGLSACMIGDTSVMHRMVMIGVLSITLCYFLLTLFSVHGVAVKLGGLRMALIFDWRSLTSIWPCSCSRNGSGFGQFIIEGPYMLVWG